MSRQGYPQQDFLQYPLGSDEYFWGMMKYSGRMKLRRQVYKLAKRAGK